MFTVKARIYFTSAMTALLVAAGSAYDIFTNSTLLEEVQTAESMHHSALLARTERPGLAGVTRLRKRLAFPACRVARRVA